MKSLCKGLCDALKPTGTHAKVSRYEQGQKYCSGCSEYVVCDEIRCICCNGILRTRPRKSRLHTKKERWVNAY